jgi:hypothetical protein
VVVLRPTYGIGGPSLCHLLPPHCLFPFHPGLPTPLALYYYTPSAFSLSLYPSSGSDHRAERKRQVVQPSILLAFHSFSQPPTHPPTCPGLKAAQTSGHSLGSQEA